MLSKELIAELQDILRDEYGVEISDNDAATAAAWLAAYFDALAQASHRSK